MNKQKAIIVDLDGTLSNCEWRLQFVKEKPKQWGKFFRGIRKDEIILPVKEYVENIVSSENAHLVFLTARPFNTCMDTLLWLDEHGYEDDKFSLYMRSDGDYRPDYVVKEEIYLDEIKDKYDIIVALDDKQEIRDMFEHHGVKAIDPTTL